MTTLSRLGVKTTSLVRFRLLVIGQREDQARHLLICLNLSCAQRGKRGPGGGRIFEHSALA